MDESCKGQRMMFTALITEGGVIKGKISFYCRMLNVTRQDGYIKVVSELGKGSEFSIMLPTK